jgi:DNA-binding beta-propeller fold protein YncE
VGAAKARQLPVLMDDAVAARLSVIGQTEDVAVSPDGQRLALACFGGDRIALVELSVERDPERGAPSAVLVQSVVMVACGLLASPHGVAFLDDRTLVVANRAADLVVLPVPPLGDQRPLVNTSGRVLVGRAAAVPVQTPEAVAVVTAGDGLAELLVCDIDRHVVSRHVIDTTAGCELLDSEELLRHRLDIPDGVTVSPCGEWIAVSNHNTNQVFLYCHDAELGPTTEPVGVLEGPNFPHGLRFTADGQHLLVADSGLPYVYTYGAADGDWRGNRQPLRTTRVMDDDEFLAGKYNPQEGGPKGLETIAAAGVVVVTSAQQTLAFFDLAELGCPRVGPVVSAESVRGRGVARRVIRHAQSDAATARVELEQLRQHSAWQSDVAAQHENTISEMREQVAELEALVMDANAKAGELTGEAERLTSDVERLTIEVATEREENARLHEAIAQLETSTSWKLTGPMRAIADRVKH